MYIKVFFLPGHMHCIIVYTVPDSDGYYLLNSDWNVQAFLAQQLSILHVSNPWQEVQMPSLMASSIIEKLATSIHGIKCYM